MTLDADFAAARTESAVATRTTKDDKRGGRSTRAKKRQASPSGSDSDDSAAASDTLPPAPVSGNDPDHQYAVTARLGHVIPITCQDHAAPPWVVKFIIEFSAEFPCWLRIRYECRSRG